MVQSLSTTIQFQRPDLNANMTLNAGGDDGHLIPLNPPHDFFPGMASILLITIQFC